MLICRDVTYLVICKVQNRYYFIYEPCNGLLYGVCFLIYLFIYFSKILQFVLG
jgi:hypothetical protein